MTTRLMMSAAAALIALTTTAQASSAFEFPYERTELETQEAREALFDRLETKARHHCRSAAPVATLAPRRAACEEQVMRAVSAQLDHPQFSALVEDAITA